MMRWYERAWIGSGHPSARQALGPLDFHCADGAKRLETRYEPADECPFDAWAVCLRSALD